MGGTAESCLLHSPSLAPNSTLLCLWPVPAQDMAELRSTPAWSAPGPSRAVLRSPSPLPRCCPPFCAAVVHCPPWPLPTSASCPASSRPCPPPALPPTWSHALVWGWLCSAERPHPSTPSLAAACSWLQPELQVEPRAPPGRREHASLQHALRCCPAAAAAARLAGLTPQSPWPAPLSPSSQGSCPLPQASIFSCACLPTPCPSQSSFPLCSSWASWGLAQPACPPCPACGCCRLGSFYFPVDREPDSWRAFSALGHNLRRPPAQPQPCGDLPSPLLLHPSLSDQTSLDGLCPAIVRLI